MARVENAPRDRKDRTMTAAPKTTTADQNDPIMADPERVAEIAQRAFGRAKNAALAENKRLGVRSYGTVGDEPRATRRRQPRTKPADHAHK
jgi:hypothetical protein